MGFRILTSVIPVATVNTDELVIMERICDITQLHENEALKVQSSAFTLAAGTQ